MKENIELWEVIFYRLEFIKDIEIRVWITEFLYKIIKLIK